ncbi:ankyrin repeat-containing protein [Anaeramoeba ignava]|uniref:Ankyrin repeat-containing protein n=1 Tax=Anaeramoeba ignava TaxID=1746090 RepID=A0A9Q0L5B4_ANAIG|nr:ankyrin repeat-containing protein [Anaeramoeba ignava]
MKENSLHIACDIFSEQYIKELITAKTEINAKNEETPLIKIFQSKKPTYSIIEFLINNGADGNSPLHFALQIEENSIEIVKLLISSGSKIKYSNNFDTPLHYACKYNHDKNVIQLLLNNGAYIDGKNFETPLHLALFAENEPEIIKLLLESHANPNIKSHGKLPIGIATKSKNPEKYLRILLNYYADPNIYFKNEFKDEYIRPLDYVIKYLQNIEIAKLLQVNGAKLQDSIENCQSYFVIASKTSQNIEFFQFLLDMGFSVNSVDQKKALYYAIKKKDEFEFVNFLVQNGANVYEKFYAAFWGASLNTIKLLVEKKVPFTEDGRTAIKLACSRNLPDYEVIEFLIKSGASIKANREKHSNSCLSIACEKSNPKLLTLLLKLGANPNEKHYIKPVDSAFSSRTKPCLKLLFDYGTEYSRENQLKTIRLSIKSGLISNKIIKSWNSITEDFWNLYKTKSLTNLIIKTIDGKLEAHQEIIKMRIGKEKLNDLLEMFSNYKSEDVCLFLRFLYTGIFYDGTKDYLKTLENSSEKDEYDQYQLIKKINKDLKKKYQKIIFEMAKEIGFDDKWIEEKKWRKGFLKDLEKLYYNEDSKDFTLIVDNVSIKVDKIVLAARSGLFNGMFSSVNDKSNSVHDYSGKTQQTIQSLIRFFYFDSLELDLPFFVLDELKYVQDYFQLNEESTLTWQIELYQKPEYRFSHYKI